ncbi:MAG: bacteriocin [Propionibacteriaceae bacterium]|nr:bacteriocin [Propionibacteriaceae bacterium]
MVDMQNLTENELAEVAGGVYCCCCCPCCCCG